MKLLPLNPFSMFSSLRNGGIARQRLSGDESVEASFGRPGSVAACCSLAQISSITRPAAPAAEIVAPTASDGPGASTHNGVKIVSIVAVVLVTCNGQSAISDIRPRRCRANGPLSEDLVYRRAGRSQMAVSGNTLLAGQQII